MLNFFSKMFDPIDPLVDQEAIEYDFTYSGSPSSCHVDIERNRPDVELPRCIYEFFCEHRALTEHGALLCYDPESAGTCIEVGYHLGRVQADVYSYVKTTLRSLGYSLKPNQEIEDFITAQKETK